MELRKIEPQELKNILEKHRKWVMNEPDGERANLSSANLRYANLSSADLSSADLSSADLSSADLSSANLRYANLRYADLKDIRDDFYKVLSLAKAEIPGLYRALWDGKISGSQYEGDCACLVGTIANVRGQNYKTLGDLIPDTYRPSERWFLGIKKGDFPQNSEIAKLTGEWIEAFMEKEGIQKPIREVIWK